MNEILYADEFTEEEKERLRALRIPLDPTPATFQLSADPSSPFFDVRNIEDREERLGKLDVESQERFHDLEVQLSILTHTESPDEERIKAVVAEMKEMLPN